MFPIIARIVRELAGQQSGFVPRAQIAAYLLEDIEASSKIDAAVAAGGGKHTREWQSVNMVDWFSKSITEGSKWAAHFERKKIDACGRTSPRPNHVPHTDMDPELVWACSLPAIDIQKSGIQDDPLGRESDLRGMLKEGRDESYSPDFLAMKEVADQEDSRGIYQTHMIEVKYRANLVRYLTQEKKEGNNSVLVAAKEKWPNLCLVFVTDNPGENRSCFQALDMSVFEPGTFLRNASICTSTMSSSTSIGQKSSLAY